MCININICVAQNMIVNGDFEDAARSNFTDAPNEFLDNNQHCNGHVTGWSSAYNSPDIKLATPHNGQNALNLFYFRDLNHNIDYNEGAFQTNLNIRAGKKYNLKFYLKSDNNAGLQIVLHKTSLQNQGNCHNPQINPGVSFYHQPSCPVGVPGTMCPDEYRQPTVGEVIIYREYKSYNVYTLVELTFIPTTDFVCIEFGSIENSSYTSSGNWVDDICLTEYCCEESKLLQNGTDNIGTNTLQSTRVYDYIKAGNNVDPNSSAGDVVHDHSTKLIFQAANKINLEPGFHVKDGSPFKANLLGCTSDFWLNLYYTVNNCYIEFFVEPCGGCGTFTYEWKDGNGNVLTADPAHPYLMPIGVITENKTYTVTVTENLTGRSYSESITVGPCGCLKPVGPPATNITICSAQDACQELGIARVPKMTYYWTASDPAAQSFISSANTSYTKVCIPEHYNNLSNLKIYLSITNECNDVVITQYSFACCSLPQVNTVNIDICNKSYYELGPQNWTNFYGYTFHWSATNQADLSLLSSQTISNPTITLNPNDPLPNFPLHYTLIGTNSCGNSFSQDYILEGTPQAPMMNSPISNGWCNYPNMPNIPCNPQYSNNAHELYLKLYINSSTVHITEIIIEIYDNSNSLVKSSTFNDVNGYNNLVNIDFSIPNINLDCIVHSYSYKIYFRRDCDIFPLFGFSASGGIQCY